ncbi:MAG: Uma2 family endonuclease, partial [Bacteroidota bacterium]
MNVEVTKRALSVDEYYKMAQVGILKPSDRVELIQGEIIEMSPVGSKHASIVKRLARMINIWFEDKVTVGVQDPVRLNDESEPEPDISILKYRADDYLYSHPSPEDVLSIIVVSDTSII